MLTKKQFNYTSTLPVWIDDRSWGELYFLKLIGTYSNHSYKRYTPIRAAERCLKEGRSPKSSLPLHINSIQTLSIATQLHTFLTPDCKENTLPLYTVETSTGS